MKKILISLFFINSYCFGSINEKKLCREICSRNKSLTQEDRESLRMLFGKPWKKNKTRLDTLNNRRWMVNNATYRYESMITAFAKMFDVDSKQALNKIKKEDAVMQVLIKEANQYKK